MARATPAYTLNDGTVLPAIGFGTYPLRGEAGVAAISSAIEAGYRLLDSAVNYENEGAVGAAVRASGVARQELVIATKLPGRHHAYADATASVQESTYRMGLDHLDLVLIHWPNPRVGRYVEAWRALCDLRRDGWVRSIGVSNFLPEHLDRIIEATGVTPSVNQIELHPYFPQVEQRADNERRGILTQAWSPLGRATALLEDPVIRRIAAAHGRSPGQTVLRWHRQLGVLPLPKAEGAGRQRENLGVLDFELSDAEMAELTALGRPDGRTLDQDPATWEEF